MASHSLRRLLPPRSLPSDPRLRSFASFVPSLSNTQPSSSGATPLAPQLQPPQLPWIPGIRRSGLLARKRGMSSFWDPEGVRIPVTVLELEDAQVVGHKYEERNSYFAVQVGCSDRRPKTVHNAQRQWFKLAGVNPKQKVAEFKVTDQRALIPVGTQLSAAHFVPGQFVDVKATSKGKGFAGVMKRWGFGGGNASHGSTKHHRKAGSTGQHQDPGRVWPGKKMAGRMGGKPVTVRNLMVARIDTQMNLLYVKGQVPGPKKAFVRVTDAEKGVHRVGGMWLRKGWSSPRASGGQSGKDNEGNAGGEEPVLLPGKIKQLPLPTICKESAIKHLPEQVTFGGMKQNK